MTRCMLALTAACLCAPAGYAQVRVDDAASGWRLSASGLHYQVVGDGDPLVFIHGAGLDARMWDREVERFRAAYRVVRYDVRGFGRSQPRERFSNSDDLRGLLDELGMEQARIVGLSLGGGIAIQFALDHPDRTAALVLSAPAVTGWQRPPEAGAPFAEAFRAAREGRLDAAVDLWAESPAARLFQADATARARVREMTRDNLPRMVAGDSQGASAPVVPAFARLEDVAARTLILVGEHEVDDLRRLTGILLARIPRAQRIELTGAGHVANMDAPRAFAAAVTRFLRSADPEVGGAAARRPLSSRPGPALSRRVWPGRAAVVRLDSAEDARRWWSSEDDEPPTLLCQSSAVTNMILVDGMPEGAEP